MNRLDSLLEQSGAAEGARSPRFASLQHKGDTRRRPRPRALRTEIQVFGLVPPVQLPTEDSLVSLQYVAVAPRHALSRFARPVGARAMPFTWPRTAIDAAEHLFDRSKRARNWRPAAAFSGGSDAGATRRAARVLSRSVCRVLPRRRFRLACRQAWSQRRFSSPLVATTRNFPISGRAH
jgi:hypothetical protein